MWPSQAVIDEALLNPDFWRERWKEWGPSVGDWCWSEKDGLRLVASHMNDDDPFGGTWWVLTSRDIDTYEKMIQGTSILIENFIPLFTPRQLWEMLMEQGYWWLLGVGASAYDYILEVRSWEDCFPLVAKTEAPDPTIALMRAVREAWKGC